MNSSVIIQNSSQKSHELSSFRPRECQGQLTSRAWSVSLVTFDQCRQSLNDKYFVGGWSGFTVHS